MSGPAEQLIAISETRRCVTCHELTCVCRSTRRSAIQPTSLLGINVGCGHFPMRPPWLNVDSDPSTPAHLHESWPPITLTDNVVDDIYAGHFLEHLSKEDGAFFLRECYRVLKPGGRLGVLVPDMQQIM